MNKNLLKGRTLDEVTRMLRKKTVEIAYHVGNERKAHAGGSLSLIEILSVLYYQVMYINQENPKDHERDRLVLSKGHSCLSLYALLSDLGFIDEKDLMQVRRLDSRLQGHPDMKKTPGIDMTAGSLGNGLGAGVGMALSAKFEKSERHIFVILGDGELNEGVVWESAQTANKFQLDNLTAIVDMNGFQGSGACDEIMPKTNIRKIWEGFGWQVTEVDGHDTNQLFDVLSTVKKNKNGQPNVIIAKTVKGKGVSFMENNNDWHQKALNEDQYIQALKEINA
jgi:transketolase